MSEFTILKQNDKITVILKEVDTLKKEIGSLKSDSDIWNIIHQKLRYSWTYNSNAIEGSTLSEGDTIFFLKEGLTVEGKPFQDFVDAKNHHEAIEYLYKIIKGERKITEGLIKEFNALLLSGIKFTKAIDKNGQAINKPATPGEYKKHANHVLQLDGTIHYYVDPLFVADEMSKLVSWIEAGKTEHPLIVAATAHYNFVRTHPFDDGNGRGARLLMNLILIKAGFPPAIIKNEKRRAYINAIIKADKGDLSEFLEFIADSLIETQRIVINELNKGVVK